MRSPGQFGSWRRYAAGRAASYLSREQRRQGSTLALLGSKRHVASHSNLTSETLSWVLRRLSDVGLIAVAGEPGSCGRVLDVARLQAVAEGREGWVLAARASLTERSDARAQARRRAARAAYQRVGFGLRPSKPI